MRWANFIIIIVIIIIVIIITVNGLIIDSFSCRGAHWVISEAECIIRSWCTNEMESYKLESEAKHLITFSGPSAVMVHLYSSLHIICKFYNLNPRRHSLAGLGLVRRRSRESQGSMVRCGQVGDYNVTIISSSGNCHHTWQIRDPGVKLHFSTVPNSFMTVLQVVITKKNENWQLK